MSEQHTNPGPDQAPEVCPGPSAAAGAEPRAWFCLRSQPKHEHIAAAHLVKFDDIQVFSPRIRFRRSTRRGPVWFIEALFPGYLFARFDWKTDLSKVRYAQGVSGVVHFNTRWPTIPDQVIADLQRSVGDSEVHEIPMAFTEGDEVRISGGTFHGLQAVVARVMPSRQRVAVLLDFLGRQTMVEVGMESVVQERFHPLDPAG